MKRAVTILCVTAACALGVRGARADPVTVSVPMPQLLQVTTPAPGAALPIRDGLTLAWTSEPTDEGEVVFLSVPGAFTAFRAGDLNGFQDPGPLGLVRMGEDDITIPFEELEAWALEIARSLADASPPQELVFPLDVDISLWRTRWFAISPPFAEGSEAGAAVELVRRPVRLTDPDGSVAAGIAEQLGDGAP